MLAGRPEVEQVLSLEQLRALQRAAEEVFVHHAVADYAVRLVMATRDPERWGVPELASQIELGASPRATLGLLSAGRAMALLRGRRFVVPQTSTTSLPKCSATGSCSATTPWPRAPGSRTWSDGCSSRYPNPGSPPSRTKRPAPPSGPSA